MTDYTNDIKRYLSGEMTAAEKHALEKKALSDPFLADAMEGAQEVSSAAFSEDIAYLTKEIEQHVQHKKTNNTSGWAWTLRIAAGLLLVAIATVIVYQLAEDPIQQQLALSENSDASEADSLNEKDSITKPDTSSPLAFSEDKIKSSQQGDAIADDRTLQSSPKINEEEKASLPAGVTQGGVAEAVKTEPILTESLSREVPTSAQAVPEKAEELTLAKKESIADDEDRKVAARSTAPSAPRFTKLLKGKVTSLEDGSALPGVNVVIKGSTQGTVTDVQGNYQLPLVDTNSTLVYSFIGLQNQEATPGNQDQLDVQMKLDVSQLSEVVVTGYGATQQKDEVPTLDLAHPEIGNKAFKEYLEKNKRYPALALDKKVEGRVTVEFFVEPDGQLTNFIVVRGIGSGCDEEVIRLIKEGPRWIPTKRNNLPVRDKARVRLKFELER